MVSLFNDLVMFPAILKPVLDLSLSISYNPCAMEQNRKAFPTIQKTFFRRVAARMAGTRLDQYITQSGIGLSRSQVEKLIQQGEVHVNNQVVTKAGYRVKEGDEIRVHYTIRVNHEIIPQPDLEIPILYEDDDVVVINKPVDMVVHPARGNFVNTLVNALLGHYQNLPHTSDRVRPGIVHRLDKDTTGVMVVARSERGVRSLSRQIEDRTAQRIYLALVWGCILTPKGEINAPIGRHPIHRTRMAVTSLHSRPALTRYRVRQRFGKLATLLEVRLATGRTHQIRVHMEHFGHPVVGDPTYSGRDTRKIFSVVPSTLLPHVREILARIERQALHAWKLSFEHPATGAWVTFEAPLPEDMNAVIEYIQQHMRV